MPTKKHHKIKKRKKKIIKVNKNKNYYINRLSYCELILYLDRIKNSQEKIAILNQIKKEIQKTCAELRKELIDSIKNEIKT